MHNRLVQLITEDELTSDGLTVKANIVNEGSFENSTEISPWCDYFSEIEFGSSDWMDDVNAFARRFSLIVKKETLTFDGEEKQMHYFVVDEQLLKRLDTYLDKRLDALILRVEKQTRPIWRGSSPIHKYREMFEINNLISESAGLRLYHDLENEIYNEISFIELFADRIGQKMYIGGIIDYHW